MCVNLMVAQHQHVNGMLQGGPHLRHQRVPLEAQPLHKVCRKRRPVHIRIRRDVSVVVANRARHFAQDWRRRHLQRVAVQRLCCGCHV